MSYRDILIAAHQRHAEAEPESTLSMLQYKNKLALQKWRERFCAASSQSTSDRPLFSAGVAGRVFSCEGNTIEDSVKYGIVIGEAK